ncbi:hypothetical protein [Azospirillum formosense]|uniref:hypothetical protein n=1 Tax=Azospirillum formosense TaxID=861533 RepID=UPI00338DBFAD
MLSDSAFLERKMRGRTVRGAILGIALAAAMPLGARAMTRDSGSTFDCPDEHAYSKVEDAILSEWRMLKGHDTKGARVISLVDGRELRKPRGEAQLSAGVIAFNDDQASVILWIKEIKSCVVLTTEATRQIDAEEWFRLKQKANEISEMAKRLFK